MQNNLHEFGALLSFLAPNVFTDLTLFDAAFNLRVNNNNNNKKHHKKSSDEDAAGNFLIYFVCGIIKLFLKDGYMYVVLPFKYVYYFSSNFLASFSFYQSCDEFHNSQTPLPRPRPSPSTALSSSPPTT